MCVDNSLSNRQTQTGTLVHAAQVPANLGEFIENPCLVLGRNSNPRILHDYFELSFVGVMAHAKTNGSSRGSELHGITDQVNEHLLDALAISFDPWQPCRQLHR